MMDKWDRKTGFCCRTCYVCAPKDDELGRCRMNAPTMQGFPVVYLDRDWCGQHKLGANPSKGTGRPRSVLLADRYLDPDVGYVRPCTGCNATLSWSIGDLEEALNFGRAVSKTCTSCGTTLTLSANLSIGG